MANHIRFDEKQHWQAGSNYTQELTPQPGNVLTSHPIRPFQAPTPPLPKPWLTPAPLGTGGCTFGPLVEYYPTVLTKALDHVDPMRVKIREIIAAKPNYPEVIDITRMAGGCDFGEHPLAIFTGQLVADLLEIARQDPDCPPSMKDPHVTAQQALWRSDFQVRQEWINKLAPQQRAALTFNQTPYFMQGFVDLSNKIHNSMSLALHQCERFGGSFDVSLLPESMQPLCSAVIEFANEAYATLSPYEKFHLKVEGRPFEPDLRPITFREMRYLRNDNRTLYDRLLESAPIPKAMPALDNLPDEGLDLSNHQIVLVQHALGSLVPLVERLIKNGADPRNIRLVPPPYSQSGVVLAKLDDMGVRIYDCHLAQPDPNAVGKEMHFMANQAMEWAINKANENENDLLVIDDGGVVTEMMKNPKYRSDLDSDPLERYDSQLPGLHAGAKFAMVEQTTRGARINQQLGVPAGATLVNMAQSKPKKLEGPVIGKSVVRGVERTLLDLGLGGLEGKTVGVVGGGTVGRAVIDYLVRCGANVVLYDSDVNALKDLPEGVHVADPRDEVFAAADVVIGTTGEESVKREDLLKLKRGCVLASASSKAVELDIDFLRGIDTSSRSGPTAPREHVTVKSGETLHSALRVEYPDPGNEFERTYFYVANCGTPVNFDGEVNCVAPDDIQLTEAIKFECIKQAVFAEPGRDIIDMETEREDRVIKLMDRCRPGWR